MGSGMCVLVKVEHLLSVTPQYLPGSLNRAILRICNKSRLQSPHKKEERSTE